jgi:hypothetical protein
MAKMVNLETLAGGAFAERTNQAIKEVLENIADPNTPWKTKRKVTIEMTFETKEDRDITEIDIVAKTKLAPKESVHTKILIDRNMDGEILGAEFRKQIPGQTAIKVDSETGEILTTGQEEEVAAGLQIVK